MKGSKHPRNDATINPSSNEQIRAVIARTGLSRRGFIRTGVNAGVFAALGGVTMGGLVRAVEAAPVPAGNGFAGIGFQSIAPGLAPVADAVQVPPGYRVEILAAWGDPIVQGAPDWQMDATQDAQAQAMQFGAHCDGMHYFPFPGRGAPNSRRGILCVNNEYTHEEILHGAEGLAGAMTIAKARKSQAAHGVSVVDLVQKGRRWTVQRNSPFGRRITGNTPMRISGPAAGHALLRSQRFDILPEGSQVVGVNDGHTAFGTLNNCAHGYTPWGTYLTCEENWNGYFGWQANDVLTDPDPETIARDQSRYGLAAGGFGYRGHEVDPRFNARTNPREPFHFGWVVEIDPFDPNSTPVKRTALGRFKHESAQVAVSAGNRVAFYMGDDERNEYIYKFVCAQPMNPRNRAANRELLEQGTLYVARFDATPVAGKPATFRGSWLALAPEAVTVIDDPANPGAKLRLRDLPAFAAPSDAEVQALILIKTRQAADALGATMMDRPEWTALWTWWDPDAGPKGYSVYDARRPLELYCTLTNNNRRGGGSAGAVTSVNKPDGSTAAGSARPPVDLANPRPDNDYGHIIRWREDGNAVTASGFEWDIFVLCGDSITSKTLSAAYQSANLVDGAAGVGPAYQGNIVDVPAGSADFGAPDGLWFDQFGRMWVQTDQAGDGSGDWVNIGANVMACADPNSKQVRRFLTGPRNAEVTGVISTPDGRTMFVGIQHPGEDSIAADPTLYSNWPQSQFATNSAGAPLPNVPGANRPRSSVLVIAREDGGIVGA